MKVSRVYVDPRTATKRSPDHCFNVMDANNVLVFRHGTAEEAEVARKAILAGSAKPYSRKTAAS